MTAVGPFSLYTAASCEPAQQVQAGQVFDLNQPSKEGGATLFRRSLWLPVSAHARSADALRVAEGSTLVLRFEAIDVDARTDDIHWMPECELAGDFLHFALALPLPIVELTGTRSIDASVHRRDGDAVTDEAVVGGRLNTPLAERISGMSFALKMSTYLEDRDGVRFVETRHGHAQAKAAKGANIAKGFGPPGDVGIVDGVVDDIIRAIPLVRSDGVLKAIRLAGKPTNPRLRLVRPASGDTPEDTLWLELRPGEQSSAQTLPADAPAKAWAPALEHCLAGKAETPVENLVLRLDVESDAPCRVKVQAISLTLFAETELLTTPQTLRFRGTRSETLSAPLQPSAGLAEQITISATLVGDATRAVVDSSALPGDGRTGTLLGADQRIVYALDLATPLRLSGIILPWYPLSEEVTWSVQLHADAGGRPALPALVEAIISADMPGAAWVALRWADLDLQGGRYWLRLATNAGSGLWLHSTSDSTAKGWLEAARSPQLNPLALGGTLAVVTMTPSVAPPALKLDISGHSMTLQPSAPGLRIEARHHFESPVPLAASLTVEAGQPLTLKIDSARVIQRL
jgi:hypothetical protein